MVTYRGLGMRAKRVEVDRVGYSGRKNSLKLKGDAGTRTSGSRIACELILEKNAT